MDGRIVRAESEAIVVETADGVEQRVEWSDVRDIDHPGNVAVLLSPLVLLGGVSCAAMNRLGGGDRSTSEIYLRSGQVLAGAMLLSGLAIWIESKARASPPVPHPERSPPP